MQFIRLIRPLNLIIIGLTMYGLGWFFDGFMQDFGIDSLAFFILTISTVIIAAAGNIINDYFDVKADRINKPERLIIGKHVKKRVAIVTHWMLNMVAFSMAFFLSWKLNSFWYVFIHLLSINILWFYSLYFKRRFLIGNVLIAALTAMVPLLVGIYTYQQIPTGEISLEVLSLEFVAVSPKSVLWVALFLAVFAFLLNLAREIVKDMEDVEGDVLLKAQTLPISLGLKKSKWVAIFILLSTCTGAMLLWFKFREFSIDHLVPIIISAFFTVLAIVFLLPSTDKNQFKRVNLLIKLAMIAGLLTPVYWKISFLYA